MRERMVVRMWVNAKTDEMRNHIVQSKFIAHLVPPTCTNACNSGTTRWLAEGTYKWVWLTYYPILFFLNRLCSLQTI